MGIDARFQAEGEGQLPIETGNTALVVQLAQAELNQAVTTARAYPRSIERAMKNILSLATLDGETAKECIYALPRGGKPIVGPSVRLAEIIASQWGNCQVGSRVVAVDRMEKVVIAEGVFHDLETGMKRIAQVQRRISDKNGKLFNDDMIAVTGNAAASVAMREAILKGVPKAIWRKAYEAAEHVIKGDIKTLVQRREEAVKAFAAWGITPEQIFACLEIEGLDDITLEEIGALTAIYVAIKNKEATVEDYFPPHTSKEKANEAARGTGRKPPVQPQEKKPEPERKAEDPQPKQEVEKAAESKDEVAPKQDAQSDSGKSDPAVAETSSATEGPAQGSLLADEPTDYSRHPMVVQFVADVEASGEENALSLWEADLAKIKAKSPDLHAAMMAAAAEVVNRG